ncbi:hypothetical protein MRAB57_2595 [Mycobacterium rhizamassiliense]|uniref:DUF4238 domain-containing protein n=2 Tax=Mycobacterium rhizamassiliense TaxID=1841860 RepID=A0A2U3NTG9_9MYCO|nr:hypothetical protein MRAB57_2595 [Mycobacterium rhizamassiliense]
MAQGTRRPHFVPRTYLKAWANDAGQVAYRRRDRDGTVVTNITNVAVASDIYGTGDAAQAREEFFQQIEEEWADLRSELTAAGDLRGERRSLAAVFAAIQLNRTLKEYEARNFVCDVAATTEERPIPKDAVLQFIARLDGSQPSDNEVEAAWTFVNGMPNGEIPTKEMVFNISISGAVSLIAPRLEAMGWTVYKYDAPVLLSSDCPVLKWRRPSAKPQSGGAGIDTADEIRFPLSPNALLVMSQESQDPRRNPNSRKINAEVVRQCHKFIFGVPEALELIDNCELSTRSPRVRFDTGPLYDAEGAYMGEILHTYVE